MRLMCMYVCSWGLGMWMGRGSLEGGFDGGRRSSGRQKIESKRNNQKERGEENVSD